MAPALSIGRMPCCHPARQSFSSRVCRGRMRKDNHRFGSGSEDSTSWRVGCKRQDRDAGHRSSRIRQSNASRSDTSRATLSCRVFSVPYQRPRLRGSEPAYGQGLHRALDSPGSGSQNFILGTKLEFRPTQTIHRRSSPQTQYRQITSRGFGGILNTSNSTRGPLALAEVSSSACTFIGSGIAPLGLGLASCGSVVVVRLLSRLIFAGKSVLISTSISCFLRAYLFSVLPPPICLLYFPELLM